MNKIKRKDKMNTKQKNNNSSFLNNMEKLPYPQKLLEILNSTEIFRNLKNLLLQIVRQEVQSVIRGI